MSCLAFVLQLRRLSPTLNFDQDCSNDRGYYVFETSELNQAVTAVLFSSFDIVTKRIEESNSEVVFRVCDDLGYREFQNKCSYFSCIGYSLGK